MRYRSLTLERRIGIVREQIERGELEHYQHSLNARHAEALKQKQHTKQGGDELLAASTLALAQLEARIGLLRKELADLERDTKAA